MARNRFGGDAASWLFTTLSRYVVIPEAGDLVTFWSDDIGDPDDPGQVQYDDLRAIDDPDTVVDSVQALDSGQVPSLDGPDDAGVTAMWASADGGLTGVWITTRTLHKAAATGDYGDLVNLPAIPDAATDSEVTDGTAPGPYVSPKTLATWGSSFRTALLGGAQAAWDTLQELKDLEDTNLATLLTAIGQKISATARGAAGGVAPLDNASKVPDANLPDRLSDQTLTAAFVAQVDAADVADFIDGLPSGAPYAIWQHNPFDLLEGVAP